MVKRISIEDEIHIHTSPALTKDQNAPDPLIKHQKSLYSPIRFQILKFGEETFGVSVLQKEFVLDDPVERKVVRSSGKCELHN